MREGCREMGRREGEKGRVVSSRLPSFCFAFPLSLSPQNSPILLHLFLPQSLFSFVQRSPLPKLDFSSRGCCSWRLARRGSEGSRRARRGGWNRSGRARFLGLTTASFGVVFTAGERSFSGGGHGGFVAKQNQSRRRSWAESAEGIPLDEDPTPSSLSPETANSPSFPLLSL